MAGRKAAGLVVAGLLFGVVVDIVGYNIIYDIICTPTHPDTCFTTEHASLSPFLNAALVLIPIATAIAFGLLQKELASSVLQL